MEFASEMVIKAALRGETIVERPVTLAPDLRDRPPHLRPWRDGWRHLRYLFMLSPAWLFALPGVALGGAGVTILAFAVWHAAFGRADRFFFGNYWVVLAGVLIALGHIAGILAGASHLQGVRAGYRRERPWMIQMARWVTLESMIVTGVALLALGLGVLVWLLAARAAGSPAFGNSVLPVVAGTLLMSLGAQNILGGFLLAIVGGNEARFLEQPEP
jgi:hypothetical protein